LQLSGSTVGEVVQGLVQKFPGMRPNLLGEDGSLHRFVNVYLNDEDIRYLEQLDTSVSEGDEVSILPAVAGG
jgi:molybdopterin converting factor small subunit